MKKILSLIIIISLFVSTAFQVIGIKVDSKEADTEYGEFVYDQRYAVIIVGTYGSKNQEKISGAPREQYYKWYTGHTMLIFNILTQKYGFDKNNIFILLTEVKEEGWTAGDIFDSNSFAAQNYYDSTKENITKVFGILKDKINSNDLLVATLIGHGFDKGTHWIPILKKYIDFKPNGYDTYFPLWSPKEAKSKSLDLFNEFKFAKRLFGEIKDSSNSSSSKESLSEIELGELTKSINSRRTIFILQPCHAGGFINSISKNNHVILAAGPEGKPIGNFLGPLCVGLGCDGFDYCDKEGNCVDKNRDGSLTLAESYHWATTHIQQSDPCIPYIDDNGDNIGSLENSTILGEDGYIASRIYNLKYELL